MEGLKDDEAAAKRGHVGIWRYGDAVDSDEDDTRFAEAGANQLFICAVVPRRARI